MSRLMPLLLVVLVCASLSDAAPMKIYKKMTGLNKYQPVLVAVSSTVIPLDELPTFTVSSHLGPATELPPPGISKPKEKTRLITVNSKKTNTSPIKKATITELTKEQFARH